MREMQQPVRHQSVSGPSHDNGFGLLRLVFAALVIVAHTPELRDGDRSREALTLLFHTLSFGELAVDGFFVISGYLITASFLKANSPVDFALRRVARIYPGFLVAYALAVLVVAPLGGVVWAGKAGEIVATVLGAFLLRQPDAGAVFAGQPHPALNGSTWTIIFEFQCYALVGLLGMAGVLRRRWVVLALTAGVAVVGIWRFHPEMPYVWQAYQPTDAFTASGMKNLLAGVLKPSARLVPVFLVGSCFYLFEDRLRFSRWYAGLAALGLMGLMGVPRLADTGFAVLGGYLILYFARSARGTIWARINNRNDVSYGLYLYAWPVEKLLFHIWPDISLWLAGCATLVVAYGLGWLSWLIVERPAMSALRRWEKKRSTAQARESVTHPRQTFALISSDCPADKAPRR